MKAEDQKEAMKWNRQRGDFSSFQGRPSSCFLPTQQITDTPTLPSTLPFSPFSFFPLSKSGNLPEYTWLSTALLEDVVFGGGEAIVSSPSKVSFVAKAASSSNGSSLVNVQLLVLVPAVEPFEAVYAVGEGGALGEWQVDKALKLSRISSSCWSVILENVPYSTNSLEYKFIIKGEGKDAKVTWEDGSNRLLNLSCDFPFRSKSEASSTSSSASSTSSLASSASAPSDYIRASEVFRRQVNFRASGIAVPVFSLRTSEGSGVGEFLDLKKMTDLCEKVGSRVIQILPVNDTSCFMTWRDSYPYSSLSVFALHPLYLRLQALTKDEAVIKRIEAQAAILNALPQIDYERVMANKNAFINEIFENEYLKRNYGSASSNANVVESLELASKAADLSSDDVDASSSSASGSASGSASTSADLLSANMSGASAAKLSPRGSGSVRGMIERINSSSLNASSGSISPRAHSRQSSSTAADSNTSPNGTLNAASGTSTSVSSSAAVPSTSGTSTSGTSTSGTSTSGTSTSSSTSSQSQSQKFSTSASSNSSFGLQRFVQKNSRWLVPYAVFVSLRDKFGTAEYSQWPEEYRQPTREQVEVMFAKAMENPSSGVERTCWVQWQLHEQLSEASSYAASKRVGLKGDLPIGVNRVSVDSWIDSNLFHMAMSTGAPPDQFSEDGQNWGFPTYDWDKMAEDNYAWWRQRLSQMAQYFHAFRIDHILGFFRIWEIPIAHSSGMMGHYNPSIAIHRHELERLGLWDLNRLSLPHIRFDIASSIAGLTTGETVHLLDVISEQGCTDHFILKESFKTDSGLSSYLDSLPDDTDASKAWKDKFRRTVAALQKNVVLLQDESNPDLFYPRVNFATSSSYRDLAPDWKQRLWELYVRYFYGEAQEEFWREIGAKRLPVIRAATRMLVCGEDLGMVPKCVEPVMSGLGILGLRVQRMPADPKITFSHPASYAHLTVCTTSSHDTSTVRGWWEENRVKSADFFFDILGEPRAHSQPPHFAEPWLCDRILQQHFHSPSMLAIFPIQDFFATLPEFRVQDPSSEQINDPSNPKHYWRYRLHFSLEQLIDSPSFISKVSEFNHSSGRS